MRRGFLIVLAISEVVVLSVAAGTVGYFLDEVQKLIDLKEGFRQVTADVGVFGREEFFLFAVGIGFIVAIISLIVAGVQRHEKVPVSSTMAGLHAFSAVTLLISASLLAKTTATIESAKYPLCDRLDAVSSDARCYQLIIGVVFGFVAVVLFIADTLIYITSFTENAGISFINMDSVAS